MFKKMNIYDKENKINGTTNLLLNDNVYYRNVVGYTKRESYDKVFMANISKEDSEQYSIIGCLNVIFEQINSDNTYDGSNLLSFGQVAKADTIPVRFEY